MGVNGSGKTTLIGILLRCLSGPFDLPSATSETELGQIRARAVPLTKRERQLFGVRVADGASTAHATLCVDFGLRSIRLTRRLSDLALTELFVDGTRVEIPAPVGREADVHIPRISPRNDGGARLLARQSAMNQETSRFPKPSLLI